MDFNKLSIGGKLILVSLVIAIISLFLPWADIGIFSLSGFQQQGFLFLILFIYPTYIVFKNVDMNKAIGIICSVIALIGSIAFYVSKSVNLFNKSINFAGTGLYVFIISSIILLIGCIKYTKPNN